MAEQTATQPSQESEDTQSGTDDATSEAPEVQDGQQDAAAEPESESSLQCRSSSCGVW